MKRKPVLAAGALISCALLTGCGSYISQLPVVGSKNIPPPPAEAPEHPSVGVKAGPDGKALSAAERAKLEAELVAARTGSVPQRRQSIVAPKATKAATKPAGKEAAGKETAGKEAASKEAGAESR